MFYLRSNEGKTLEEIEEEIRRKELLEKQALETQRREKLIAQQALAADVGAIATAPVTRPPRTVAAINPRQNNAWATPSVRAQVPAFSDARTAVVNQALERRRALPFTPAPAELSDAPVSVYDPNQTALAQIQRHVSGESLGERYARENQALRQRQAIDRFAGEDTNLLVDSVKRLGQGTSELAGNIGTGYGRLFGKMSPRIGDVQLNPGAAAAAVASKKLGAYFRENSTDPSFKTTPLGTLKDWEEAVGVREATIAALKLAGNEAPKSLAYMSLIMTSIPGALSVLVGDVERLARDRAAADKRDPEQYTFGDAMAVVPAAGANVYLERLLGHALAGQFGKLPFSVTKRAEKLLANPVGKAATLGTTQGAIEAGQEVGEYTASHLGTKTGFDFEDAKTAGTLGWLVGTPVGVGLSATGSALEAASSNATHTDAAKNIIENNPLTPKDEVYLERITQYIKDRHPDIPISPNSGITEKDGYNIFEYGTYDEDTGVITSISPKAIIGGTENYDDAIKRIARTVRHETIHTGAGLEEEKNQGFLSDLYFSNKDKIIEWAANNPAYSHLLEGEGSLNDPTIQAKLANEALANAGEVDITFTGRGMVHLLGMAEKMGIPISSNDSMRVVAQKVYGNVPSESHRQKAARTPPIKEDTTRKPLMPPQSAFPLREELDAELGIEEDPDIESYDFAADDVVAQDRDIDLEGARAETDTVLDRINETLSGIEEDIVSTVRTAGQLSAAAAKQTDDQKTTRDANNWVAKQGLKMMDSDEKRQQLKAVQRLWGQPVYKLMGKFPGTLADFKKLANAISKGDMQYVEDTVGEYLQEVNAAKAERARAKKEEARVARGHKTRYRTGVKPYENVLTPKVTQMILQRRLDNGEITQEEFDAANERVIEGQQTIKTTTKLRQWLGDTLGDYKASDADQTWIREQAEIYKRDKRVDIGRQPPKPEEATQPAETTAEQNARLIAEFEKKGGRITQVEADQLAIKAQKDAFRDGSTEKTVTSFRTEQLEQLTGFELDESSLMSAEAKDKSAYMGSDFQYTPRVAPEMEGVLREWKADEPDAPAVTEGTVHNAAYDFIDWPEGDIANRVGLLDGSTKVKVLGTGELIGGHPSVKIETTRRGQAPITHYVPTKRIKISSEKWKELARQRKIDLWNAHVAEQLGDKPYSKTTKQEKLDLLKSWWKRDNPEQMPDTQKRSLYESVWGSSQQISKLVKAMNLGGRIWSKQHNKALDDIFTPEFIAGVTLDNPVALDAMSRNNLFIEPQVFNNRAKKRDAAETEGTGTYVRVLYDLLNNGVPWSEAHDRAAKAAAKIKGYLTPAQQKLLEKSLKENKTGDVGELPIDVRDAYMKSLELAAYLNDSTILNPKNVEGLFELTVEAQGYINSSMEQINALNKAKSKLQSAEAKKRDDDYDTKALQTHFTSQTALALFRFLVSKPASDVGAFNRESFLGRGNQGDVPAASIIQNIIFSDFSSRDRPEGMETRLDMTQQMSARTGEFATELGMIFSKVTNRMGVVPPDVNAEIISYLAGKDVEFSSPNIETAAKEAKEFFEKVYKYAKDRTKGLETPLDLRGAGDTVIPRVWNVDYLATRKGKSQFMEAIAEKFTDPKGRSILEEAGISPEELYSVVVNSGGFVQGEWTKMRPSLTLSKKDVERNELIQEYLDSLSTEELVDAGLVVDNIQAIAPTFLHKAVTRAEYAAAFGANNELLNQWIDLGVKQIADHNAKVLARGEDATGTLIDEKLFRKTVYDMSEILRNKYGYDKVDMPTRKTVQMITNFETIVKLPLVTIASFPEIFTHAIPFGLDPKTFATDLLYATAFAGYKGMSGISKLVFNKHLPAMLKRAEDMEGFLGDIRTLQELGISDPTGFGNDGAVTRYGNASFMAGGLRAGGARGTLAGRIPPNVRAVFNMRTYMQATMLTTLTEMQQFMALRNYQRNMHKRLTAIKEGKVKGDKLKQYTQDLLDYGLTPDIDLSTAEGMAQFNGGAIRFVNRVITKPTGANTAKIFQNPLTAPLVLFERFITTYGNTLLASTARNFADKVNNVERAKQAGNLIVAGAGMYGTVVFGEILRAAIKGDLDEEDFEVMPKDLETLIRRADRMGVGGAPGAMASNLFFPSKHWYGDTGQNRLVRELGPVGGDFAAMLNYLMSDEKGQEQFIRLMGQVAPMSKQILPKPKKKNRRRGKSYADSFK